MARRDRRTRDFSALTPETQQQVIDECLAIGVQITPIPKGACENCDASGERWAYGLLDMPAYRYCGKCVSERVIHPDEHRIASGVGAPSVAERAAYAETEGWNGKRMGDAVYRDIPAGASDGIITSGLDSSAPQRPTEKGDQ